ncbi:hypothetical protein CBR_g34816 [Chara braunii]|uniref:CCHC-type domain-containing protein n=1 Tax=Chara braunii TaxID=69332 RepID=A0A388LJE4_CHABU|nr:hypothetical protein CBR_g34816 [Chara braunii]|eukprot:GBG82439.1 hypothetical protein CBR_g34816 [Chara braunii]
MSLTNETGRNGYWNEANTNQNGVAGQGLGSNGYSRGGGGVGSANNACFTCGKIGHYARDCWSKRGRSFGNSQNSRELEEMKEHFRIARKERLELEEKRKLEEERRVREEKEIRRNPDFARKAEEFKLQLRAELLEEWRKNQAEASRAGEKTKGSTKKKKTTSWGRGKRRRGKRRTRRDTTSDETKSGSTSKESEATTTTSDSDSEGQRARTKPRGRRKAASTKGKGRRSTKEKGKDVYGHTPPRVYEKGECSRPRKTGPAGATGNAEPQGEEKAEPVIPLTGGYKGLAAGCSQKGLIDYCISAHKIYSAKKADALRKICERKGIRYTKKPEVVKILARQQVQLPYDGFEEVQETWEKGKSSTKTKASGLPRQELRKEKLTSEKPAKQVSLASLPTRTLIGLYKTAGFFTEKETKYRLRTKLDRIIKRKTGVSMRRKICVKLQFGPRIKKNGVREATGRVIEAAVKDKHLALFLQTRIRIIWVRNRNVVEQLHNHKDYTTEREQVCTCKETDLPKHEGHVLTRFTELEIPQFVRNARNITRPANACTVEAIGNAIREATKHLKGAPGPELTSGMEGIDREFESPAWTDAETREWGRRFHGIKEIRP